MVAGIRTSAEIVIVNRLSLAGFGAGFGLIGVGVLVVARDLLKNRLLSNLGAALVFGGAGMALLLPIPASFAASGVLSRAGYQVCKALSEPSFKLTRTAWVRPPSACRSQRVDMSRRPPRRTGD